MTLNEIMLEFGLGKPQFYSVDNSNEYSLSRDWRRHWDNEKRVSLIIHADVLQDCTLGPNTQLEYTQSERNTPSGTYLAIIITKAIKTITPVNVYVVFAESVWDLDENGLDIVSYHRTKEGAEKKIEYLKYLVRINDYVWKTERARVGTITLEE